MSSAVAEWTPGRPRPWGNALYVGLAIGEAFDLLGKSVRLVAVEGSECVVDVAGDAVRLVVARRALPQVVHGVRLFAADNRVVAGLTTDAHYPHIHGATTRDALLCFSDPAAPLLDPGRCVFPISRADGYRWLMEEDSHMFAYLEPWRSHEGIDLDVHDARGKTRHALVAIEAGTVRWVAGDPRQPQEACVLLESASQPGIYYVYKHLNAEKVFVSAGQKVAAGEELAFIWGDNRWGHLHFSVVGFGPVPDYGQRYRYLLNHFPAMYELWHGELTPRPRVYSQGAFQFGRSRHMSLNRTRLSVFDEVVGYGWLLGAWNPAAKVERPGHNDSDRNARLRRTLFAGTPAEATHPEAWFEFEVAVPNGTYAVSALVGDQDLASWQRVSFEGVGAGEFACAGGEFARTPEKVVGVRDGRLTVRLDLKDAETPAGLSELRFWPAVE